MASETPPDPVTRRRAVLAELLVREAELVDLSAALDEPVARETDFKLAVLALAQRARTWFRGFIALQDSPVPAAGLPLLRLAAEINILIRFLEMDPALHTELWQAEGERLSLATIEEHNAKHVERWGAIPIDPRRSTRGARRFERLTRKLWQPGSSARPARRCCPLPHARSS